jgi:hypothetical protein
MKQHETQFQKIQRAQRLKARNSLHAVGWFDYQRLSNSEAFLYFMDYVKEGLEIPTDKLKSFERALNPILPTFSITNEIYRYASEIFNSDDKVYTIPIKDSTEIEDRIFNFVKRTAFETAKVDTSTYVFVTSEEGAEDDFTLECIGIDSLVKVKQYRNSSDQLIVTFIAWNISYNDEVITIEVDKESVVWKNAKGVVIKEDTHGIGYCPGLLSRVPYFARVNRIRR